MSLFRNLWVACCLIPLATVAMGADPVPPQRTISTSGQATVYVTPDVALLSVAVETFDKELAKAQKDNRDACASLVKAIKTVGIKEEDISTSEIQASIDYTDNPGVRSRRGEIMGYTILRSYVVKTTDRKLVEPLVDAALKNGANILNGLTWESSKLREHKDAARAMAAKAAKEKAVAIAKELDAKVGKVQTITEETFQQYYGLFQNNNNNSNNAGGPAAGDVAPEDEGTIPAGKIAIRANVSAVFLLE